MKLGPMRYRVTLQHYIADIDKDGFVERSWQEKCTVWADIVALSSKEIISSATETEIVQYKVFVRYRPDIDNTMRLFWNGKQYLISTVTHDMHKHITTLLIKEVSTIGENENKNAGGTTEQAEQAGKPV